jgi:hypothetical protein
MLYTRRRADGDVFSRRHGDVAFGEVLAGNEGHVLTGDQRAVWSKTTVGLGQVEHRHQHVFAIHFTLFEPDDVVGERRYLLGGQRAADCQVELGFAGDGVVHQVLELILVGGLSIDERLAGTRGDGLLHQTLFVEAITQALGAFGGVVAEAREQVVGALELLEVGEHRVGFDQVFAGVGRGYNKGVRPLLSEQTQRLPLYERQNQHTFWRELISHSSLYPLFISREIRGVRFCYSYFYSTFQNPKLRKKEPRPFDLQSLSEMSAPLIDSIYR